MNTIPSLVTERSISERDAPTERTTPLCVDLDGTLIKTDLLMEGVVLLLKKNIFYVFLLAVWLSRGKAYLKQQVCRRVKFDVAALPYNQSLLNLLRVTRRSGRQILLVTAADRGIAEEVAAHLKLFCGVIASDGTTNLCGTRKLRALKERFADSGFDYAANASVDLAIWREADRAIVVNASPGTRRRAGRVSTVEAVIEDRPALPRSVRKALRPHQWVKNLLLFVPLVTSHQVANLSLLGQAALAFIAFCLCASSVYVLNDLLDIQADRRHPEKRARPFAAGNLSVGAGLALAVALLAASAGISLLLPVLFQLTLALYYGTTLAYSLYLKRKLYIDVHVLAGLYTIRVLAGGTAVGVMCSAWLLAFSMFLFLSLALVKRYSELRRVGRRKRATRGRGYRASDRQIIANLGTGSGLICALVLALYINSPQVGLLYSTPDALWLLCPLVMYWVGRIWLIAHRGRMDSDPVVFAIKDKMSYVVGVCGGAVIAVASYQWTL